MRNIVFIAPPAAGKGTQAAILKDKFNISHISTGDLLREEAKRDTKFGITLSEQMKSGKLISDEVVTELLKKRLLEDDTNNGYILDGYPRNISQAEMLENILLEIGKPINYVIYLNIDQETALERACGRLQCSNCGKIYNKYINESKPKTPNICDVCNIELTHRADDNEDSFKERFKTFIDSTKPVIDFYNSKGLLYIVDSTVSKEYTSEQIRRVLEK